MLRAPARSWSLSACAPRASTTKRPPAATSPGAAAAPPSEPRVAPTQTRHASPVVASTAWASPPSPQAARHASASAPCRSAAAAAASWNGERPQKTERAGASTTKTSVAAASKTTAAVVASARSASTTDQPLLGARPGATPRARANAPGTGSWSTASRGPWRLATMAPPASSAQSASQAPRRGPGATATRCRDSAPAEGRAKSVGADDSSRSKTASRCSAPSPSPRQTAATTGPPLRRAATATATTAPPGDAQRCNSAPSSRSSPAARDADSRLTSRRAPRPTATSAFVPEYAQPASAVTASRAPPSASDRAVSVPVIAARSASLDATDDRRRAGAGGGTASSPSRDDRFA